jgi:hypothetical protein
MQGHWRRHEPRHVVHHALVAERSGVAAHPSSALAKLYPRVALVVAS